MRVLEAVVVPDGDCKWLWRACTAEGILLFLTLLVAGGAGGAFRIIADFLGDFLGDFLEFDTPAISSI